MSDKKKTLQQLVAASSISLLSLTAAQAVVNLEIDDNIKVTVINGQPVATGIFEEAKKNFTLQPGQHVITAKYDRLYILPRSEHDYLRSNNVTVTAEMLDNQTYRLAMPNQPEDYEAAKEYIKKPTLAVMQGSKVIAQETSLKQDVGLFAGLSGLFGGQSAEIDNQKAIAAVNSQSGKTSTVTPSVAPVSTATVQKSTAQQASTLDSFMQLWLQSTPQEREKIRQWVDE